MRSLLIIKIKDRILKCNPRLDLGETAVGAVSPTLFSKSRLRNQPIIVHPIFNPIPKNNNPIP
jgi:hypothetical protein